MQIVAVCHACNANKDSSALKFRLPMQIVADCLNVMHAVQMKLAVHWIAGSGSDRFCMHAQQYR